MSQKENFDKAFAKRANEMNFEFNEAHWQTVSALLNEDNKNQRRPIWVWVGGGMAVLALLSGALLLLNNTADFIAPKQHVHDDVYMPDKDAFQTKEESQNRTKTTQDTFDTKITFAQSSNSSQDRVIQADQYNPAPNQYKSPQAHPINAENFSTLASANQFFKLSNEVSSNLKDLNMENNKISSKRVNINLVHLHQEHALNESTTSSKMPNSTKLAVSHPSDLTFVSLIHTPTLHKVTVPEAKLAQWTNHVGVLAGTNFGRNFPNSDGMVGGLGSYIGLRFQYAHSKGFMLNTGLTFAQNQINGLVYEETRTVFGYEQYDLVNTIKYQNMFCAHVPLFVGYEAERFSISAGLKLNFILNTKGRVYTWDNTVFDQSVWGYAHGMKNLNMMCGAEATYRLARRWDLGWSIDLDLSPRSQLNNDLISPSAQLWQTGLFVKYRLN